jgi:hypothetical protein
VLLNGYSKVFIRARYRGDKCSVLARSAEWVSQSRFFPGRKSVAVLGYGKADVPGQFERLNVGRSLIDLPAFCRDEARR